MIPQLRIQLMKDMAKAKTIRNITKGHLESLQGMSHLMVVSETRKRFEKA